MPFRLKVFLSIFLALFVLLLVGPLLLPVPPLEGTVPEAELAGPASRFIEVGDLSFHYEETRNGTAPAFVMLHGFGSSAASWRDLRRSLGVYGRAVAFDRPGFGLTERPMPGSWQRGENPYSPEAQVRHTVATMNALGIEEAVLIGNSSGAAAALQTALEHPDRVSALVLVGGAVYRAGGPPRWSRPLLHTPQLARLGPLLMRQLGGQPGLDLYRSGWADPGRIDDEDYAAYRLPLQAKDWDRALWEVSKASHEPGFLARLDEIAVPTLVVTGSEDAIVPPEQSERLARELPDATLAVMDGCGHLAQEECPAALADLVEGWLAQRGLLGP